MTECEKIISDIERYIDDELDDERRKEITEHMKICQSCRTELEFAQAVRAALSDMNPPPVPKDFSERVNNGIDKKKKINPGRFLGKRSFSVVAACLAIAAVLSLNEKNNLVENVNIGNTDEISMQYKETVISNVAEIDSPNPTQSEIPTENNMKTTNNERKTQHLEETEKTVGTNDTNEVETAENDEENLSVQNADEDFADDTAEQNENAHGVQPIAEVLGEEVPQRMSLRAPDGAVTAVYSEEETTYAVLVDETCAEEVEKAAMKFGVKTNDVYEMDKENYKLFSDYVTENGFDCDLPEIKEEKTVFTIVKKDKEPVPQNT